MATFNIRDHGALGDGITNDAAAIQAAIDACNVEGGGTVLVPAGATFLSGSIGLKSNVELHLERGATLQCSGDWEAITERWLVTALSGGIVTEKTRRSGSFISAKHATNIALTGAGTVDGGGRFYILEDLGPIYRMPVERPFTVFLYDCTEVHMSDTLYRDGALWTVRLTGCENVMIHAIRIDGDMKLPNADGIDLDHCRNVRISDCYISTPDDCISLKTCEEFADMGPCENITVTNCVLRSRSSALVVGVDVSDPIRNVVFDNIIIRDSHRGMSVNMGQASHYENILFSNIVVETRIFDDRWWGRGEPIYVSAMPWHDEVGTVRNIRFVNILARGENGVYIEGLHTGLIEGVVLENVKVEIVPALDQPGGQYDRRPYSGDSKIYEHATAGFFVMNASDVAIRNCQVVWSKDRRAYFGHGLETINVPGLHVEGFRGDSAFPERLAAVLQA